MGATVREPSSCGAKEKAMYAVIFEVEPEPDRLED
jgi:hypothetical protein